MLLVSPGAIDNKSIGSKFSQRSRMACQSITYDLKLHFNLNSNLGIVLWEFSQSAGN